MNEKNILKWALIAGIVIVLNLFFNYGLSVFYPAPEWNDFCGEEAYKGEITTENACTETGGKWIEYAEPQTRPMPTSISPNNVVEVTGYCDTTFYCRAEFDDVNGMYQRTAFIVLVILGVLSLLGGIFLTISPVVSTGLSYGGVLSLIIASMRYWGTADDIIRLLILAAALGALILLGIKKFNK